MAGRDVRVAFKISEEKHVELKEMAESYGVTMSALVALVVGQWLHQQNKVVGPMLESMRQVVEDTLKENLKDEGEDRKA